jgi:hypothetical protein
VPLRVNILEGPRSLSTTDTRIASLHTNIHSQTSACRDP